MFIHIHNDHRFDVHCKFNTLQFQYSESQKKNDLWSQDQPGQIWFCLTSRQTSFWSCWLIFLRITEYLLRLKEGLSKKCFLQANNVEIQEKTWLKNGEIISNITAISLHNNLNQKYIFLLLRLNVGSFQERLRRHRDKPLAIECICRRGRLVKDTTKLELLKNEKASCTKDTTQKNFKESLSDKKPS